MKKEKTKPEEVKEEILDIPEDEIWTYKIDGLAAPKINASYKDKKLAKAMFIVFMVVAIFVSLFFSVRALLNTGDLEYNRLENGSYQLKQFSNNGSIVSFTVDNVATLNYDASDTNTLLGSGDKVNDGIVYDESKKVSAIHEFAFNCDGHLQTVYIGAGVTEIDEKAFYSCWALQRIIVDENNPSYCDIDGVLYNKDKTEIICYPIDHDRYLRLKTGYAHMENGEQVSDLVDDSGAAMEELWGTTDKYDEAYFEQYNKDVRTYVIASTVTKIGPLCFNYANLTDVYIPEGVKEIGTLGFFDAGNIRNIYSYKTDTENLDPSYKAIEGFSLVYPSLPEGLEKIGSDCFTKDRGLSYMYIPESVTYIGHHAFWGAVYKSDGKLIGISEMNVAASEESFANTQLGKPWLPKYDYMLFKKSITVNYSAERATLEELQKTE